MYRKQYKDINITPESKIIIGLGDSFTQGQGACSLELWKKHNWKLKEMGQDPNVLDSEYEGSWVNQLYLNHLNDYIPINLGMRGCGNRAAVKELYLHPKLNLEIAKEKIVIFMLSGMERFDFINRDFSDHHHFFTMWPNPWDPSSTHKNLWEIYANDIWSNSFTIIELLLNIKEAETWCKANNAKLIITNAFRDDINRNSFLKLLRENVKNLDESIIDIIDWNNFFYPNGYGCFTDLLINLEGRNDLIGGGFYGWAMSFNEMTPKGFLTKCAHPSINGHKVIANELYNHIKLKYLTNE